MNSPTDQPDGPVVSPTPATKELDDSPAATFHRLRMLRRDGYRPPPPPSAPARHLRLLD